MSLSKTLVLAGPPDQVLRFFTEFAAKWWPTAFRQTEGWDFEVRTIYTQGRFYERDAKGREVELGKILLWAAPHTLQFECYFLTTREHPTRLTLHFAPEGSGTRVTLEHRPIPSSEQRWEQHAAVFDAAWEEGLAKLAQVARQEEEGRRALLRIALSSNL